MSWSISGSPRCRRRPGPRAFRHRPGRQASWSRSLAVDAPPSTMPEAGPAGRQEPHRLVSGGTAGILTEAGRSCRLLEEWDGLSLGVTAMRTVNMHEAKTHLSRLVEGAAQGEPFIIARAGKPLVKVLAVDAPESGPAGRTGFLAGRISLPRLRPLRPAEAAGGPGADRGDDPADDGRSGGRATRACCDRLLEHGYTELPVTGVVDLLPPIHKDPFDRLLVAQARSRR